MSQSLQPANDGGWRSHPDRVRCAQPIDQGHDLVVHAKQIRFAGAEGILTAEAQDQARIVTPHLFDERSCPIDDLVQVFAVAIAARLVRGADVEI